MADDSSFDPALPPHRDGRGFCNPPGSARQRGTAGDWLRFMRDLAFGPKSVRMPEVPPGHLLQEGDAIRLLDSFDDRDTITWLGHACFLMRLGGSIILTDPYLSAWASPIPGMGPKRYAGTGLALGQLPMVDVIVLSHNHYDHLDVVTLKQLVKNCSDAEVIVPLGLAKKMRKLGFKHVDELDWGEFHQHGAITVTALPAVHFSSRTPFDRDKTLWCGFAIVSSQRRVYFAGDTAWGDVFDAAGERFGPFDLGLIPIGAYEPRKLMQPVHANPEEAVRIGIAMRAHRIAAMHWGTVSLTTEPPFEPPVRFRAAARVAGYDDERAWVMKIGETKPIDDPERAPVSLR